MMLFVNTYIHGVISKDAIKASGAVGDVHSLPVG